MEWSDIRVFLQVVREGTMAGATNALQLDHSTISRRISRLERQAAVSLFDRAGRRLTLTTEGEKLVLAAEKLESIIVREVMSLSDEREHIHGQVRIGATEDFGAHYLAPRLSELTARHPDLEVELVAVSRVLSLATREVDVLVTMDRPLTGEIRLKKLTDFQIGVYGSAAYFGARERPTTLDDLTSETWCGYIRELIPTSELDFSLRGSGGLDARYRTTSVTAQLAAVVGGYAMAALPRFVADAHPVPERVLSDDELVQRTYWLAVHEDLAKHPRVRAVMSAIETMVERDRQLFLPALAGVATHAELPEPFEQNALYDAPLEVIQI